MNRSQLSFDHIHLESHVFQEVGHSVVLGIFISRSGVDPESDGGGGSAGVLSGHADSVVQDADLGGRSEVAQRRFLGRGQR